MSSLALLNPLNLPNLLTPSRLYLEWQFTFFGLLFTALLAYSIIMLYEVEWGWIVVIVIVLLILLVFFFLVLRGRDRLDEEILDQENIKLIEEERRIKDEQERLEKELQVAQSSTTYDDANDTKSSRKRIDKGKINNLRRKEREAVLREMELKEELSKFDETFTKENEGILEQNIETKRGDLESRRKEALNNVNSIVNDIKVVDKYVRQDTRNKLEAAKAHLEQAEADLEEAEEAKRSAIIIANQYQDLTEEQATEAEAELTAAAATEADAAALVAEAEYAVADAAALVAEAEYAVAEKKSKIKIAEMTGKDRINLDKARKELGDILEEERKLAPLVEDKAALDKDRLKLEYQINRAREDQAKTEEIKAKEARTAARTAVRTAEAAAAAAAADPSGEKKEAANAALKDAEAALKDTEAALKAAGKTLDREKENKRETRDKYGGWKEKKQKIKNIETYINDYDKQIFQGENNKKRKELSRMAELTRKENISEKEKREKNALDKKLYTGEELNDEYKAVQAKREQHFKATQEHLDKPEFQRFKEFATSEEEENQRLGNAEKNQRLGNAEKTFLENPRGLNDYKIALGQALQQAKDLGEQDKIKEYTGLVEGFRNTESEVKRTRREAEEARRLEREIKRTKALEIEAANQRAAVAAARKAKEAAISAKQAAADAAAALKRSPKRAKDLTLAGARKAAAAAATAAAVAGSGAVQAIKRSPGRLRNYYETQKFKNRQARALANEAIRAGEEEMESRRIAEQGSRIASEINLNPDYTSYYPREKEVVRSDTQDEDVNYIRPISGVDKEFVDEVSRDDNPFSFENL